MERFGQRSFMNELTGPDIHRLTNILTLDHHLHSCFDRLVLWLEADNVSWDYSYRLYGDLKPFQTKEHTYRICSSIDLIIGGLPDTVTFTKHADFDLPDPRYLKMHAACCRVAHMSGAAGYLNDIMDDLDEGRTKVLSEDGSGGRILDFALLVSSRRRMAAHWYLRKPNIIWCNWWTRCNVCEHDQYKKKMA